MPDDKQPNRDPRIANLDVVQLVVEDTGEKRYEQIDNISRSGLFVRTDNPLPVSCRVSLIFSLVTDTGSEEGAEPDILSVKVKGEVVRHVGDAKESGISGPGMGIKFIGLDPKATSLIDQVVSRRMETTPTGA